MPVQRAKPPVQPAPTAPPRHDDEDWDLGGAKEPYTYTAGFAFIGRNKRPQVRIDCYVGDEWVSEYGYRFTNREVTEPTDRRVTWAIKQLGFRIERGSTWKKVEHEEWMIDVEETGEPGVGSFPKVQPVDEVVSRILR
ncbi:hypothetical protein AB0M79_35690 [Polymorphospora sp. NPDC051019]|uniref:hypothetical protein n=1 Tax=Polymorphospora sp. NPDC051019 TaxID=3155725 RepID=UPI00343D7C82